MLKKTRKSEVKHGRNLFEDYTPLHYSTSRLVRLQYNLSFYFSFYEVCQNAGMLTLTGGDNWRRVHGSERIAETKRWKTHCWDLQYGTGADLIVSSESKVLWDTLYISVFNFIFSLVQLTDLQYGSWSTGASITLHSSSSSRGDAQTTYWNTQWTLCSRCSH